MLFCEIFARTLSTDLAQGKPYSRICREAGTALQISPAVLMVYYHNNNVQSARHIMGSVQSSKYYERSTRCTLCMWGVGPNTTPNFLHGLGVRHVQAHIPAATRLKTASQNSSQGSPKSWFPPKRLFTAGGAISITCTLVLLNATRVESYNKNSYYSNHYGLKLVVEVLTKHQTGLTTPSRAIAVVASIG